MNNQLPKIVKKLPTTPGVYIYKNSLNEIIYVGKAINLKRRVTQYFQSNDALGPKTEQLVSQIDSIDWKLVGSEIEALILEASLIKKHKPKYNSQLKDDRSYIYITISKNKFPVVSPAFKSTLNPNSYFYGPFPNSSAVKSLLKTIRRIFPFYSGLHHPTKKCLYCHLGLCPGPNIDNHEYKVNISRIKSILNGKIGGLIRSINKEMDQCSKAEKYEQATIKRDQIASLKYIISGWNNLNHLFDQIELQEDQISKAENQLKTILGPYFNKLTNINRMEAYDISNLGTKYFVGSMVVYQNGRIEKDEYRKFKIYTKVMQDDQFMIKEVVWRRFKHPEWTLPNIILVDGGKPQVSSVYKLFSILNITDVALIGLAKREETIVIKTPLNWVEVNLPKNSEALRLLQRLRDEAHRFANHYRQELIKRSLK